MAVATDLSFGMLHAGRQMDERVQADASLLPFRSAGFDGDHLRLRAAQLHRPRGDL